MTDVFVHPRWTPTTGFGGVPSVVSGSTIDDWVIANSNPTTGLVGWQIAGYTEAIVTLRNYPVSGSEIEYVVYGSLDRSNWFPIPMYDRVEDDFVETGVLGASEIDYETLESDRWHYLMVKMRTASALGGADSVASYVVGIGGATI